MSKIAALYQPQLRNITFKLSLFHDERIARSKRLDLRKGKRCFVNVLTGTHGGFPRHNLRDEALFVLYDAPHICVKRTLRHIAEHLDRLILIALAYHSAFALLDVARSPRHIEVVERSELCLHVCPGSHLECRADEYTHLPGAHFGKQLRFGGISLGVMDKGDFVFGDALCHELLPHIVIDVLKTAHFKLTRFILFHLDFFGR